MKIPVLSSAIRIVALTTNLLPSMISFSFPGCKRMDSIDSCPLEKTWGEVISVLPIWKVGVICPSRESVAGAAKLTVADELPGSVRTDMFAGQITVGGGAVGTAN